MFELMLVAVNCHLDARLPGAPAAVRRRSRSQASGSVLLALQGIATNLDNLLDVRLPAQPARCPGTYACCLLSSRKCACCAGPLRCGAVRRLNELLPEILSLDKMGVPAAAAARCSL